MATSMSLIRAFARIGLIGDISIITIDLLREACLSTRWSGQYSDILLEAFGRRMNNVNATKNNLEPR
jgi:acyl carrier protein phosphodiesterase